MEIDEKFVVFKDHLNKLYPDEPADVSDNLLVFNLKNLVFKWINLI